MSVAAKVRTSSGRETASPWGLVGLISILAPSWAAGQPDLWRSGILCRPRSRRPLLGCALSHRSLLSCSPPLILALLCEWDARWAPLVGVLRSPDAWVRGGGGRPSGCTVERSSRVMSGSYARLCGFPRTGERLEVPHSFGHELVGRVCGRARDKAGGGGPILQGAGPTLAAERVVVLSMGRRQQAGVC